MPFAVAWIIYDQSSFCMFVGLRRQSGCSGGATIQYFGIGRTPESEG